MREIKFRAWDKLGQQMLSSKVTNAGLGNIPKNWELMQYRGLKDKNGKEIYESDLVEIGEITYIVGFECGSFVFSRDETDYFNLFDFKGMKNVNNLNIEIIGNIYENPELTKNQ